MENWINKQQKTLSAFLAWQTVTALNKGDRDENQDNLLVITPDGQVNYMKNGKKVVTQHELWWAKHMRIAVLDGMGGHACGQEISEHVAQALASHPPFASQNECYQILDELHQTLIAEYSQWNNRAPGTTITLLEIPDYDEQGCEAWLYHMGDSRLYELASTQLPCCLTLDHVPATKSLLSGLISKEKWREEVYQKNGYMIAQAFGYGSQFTTFDMTKNNEEHSKEPFVLGRHNLPKFLKHMSDRRSVMLKAGHVYVFATDGLWNVEQPQALVEKWQDIDLSKNAEDICEDLFMHLNEDMSEYISSDNITAVVLRIGEGMISSRKSASNNPFLAKIRKKFKKITSL